jgi:hypothetical protein
MLLTVTQVFLFSIIVILNVEDHNVSTSGNGAILDRNKV